MGGGVRGRVFDLYDTNRSYCFFFSVWFDSNIGVMLWRGYLHELLINFDVNLCVTIMTVRSRSSVLSPINLASFLS